MTNSDAGVAQTVAEQNAWRDGPYLVVRRKWNDFPDRCIVCNAPAVGDRLKLKVREVPAPDKALMAFMLLGPILPLVLCFIPSATVNVGLCSQHRAFEIQRRRRFVKLLTAAMLLLTPALLSLTPIGNLPIWDSMLVVYAFCAGICILVASGVYPVMRKRLITAKKIEKRYVWLDEVASSYLEQFPLIPAADD